ncbi:MAG: methyltransferase [Euryarchaeota archaeon]|nr:methyltransferase [Euryarchaeota archaeon]
MPRSAGSPARIMQMARGFWETKALASAVELGLFSRFDGRSFTSREAAQALACSSRGMDALLASLTALGLLRASGRRSFRLAPDTSRFLVEGKPGYVGDYVLLCGNRMYSSWSDLTRRIREGRPAGVEAGADVFRSMDTDGVRRFTLGMHGMSQDSARHVFSKVSLAGRVRLIDVGGGSGAFIHAALRKWKGLSGTVFDRKTVLEVARSIARGTDLEARMAFAEGDLFDGPYAAGDAMVLSKILHDWSPGKDAIILRNCFEALSAGGILIIAEWFLDDDRRGPKDAALGSLNMLAEAEGANYAWSEYEEWARRAGFVKTRRVRLPRGGAINGVLILLKESQSDPSA